MLSTTHPNVLKLGAGGSHPLPDRHVLLALYVLEAPPDSGVMFHLCLHLTVQPKETNRLENNIGMGKINMHN